MLKMNRCPAGSFHFCSQRHSLGEIATKEVFLGLLSPDLSFMSTIHLCRCKWVYLTGVHLDCVSGPFRLDFWFLLSFWPWIRKSFFLRSFCRFSFSSSSFCFTLKCSLLCRCRCSLAFFIFWLCTVLRASSRARIWQGQTREHQIFLQLQHVQGPTYLGWLHQNQKQPMIQMNGNLVEICPKLGNHNLHGDISKSIFT